MIPYDSYLQSGLQLTVWWSSQIAAGTVDWKVYLERVNDGASISSDSFLGPYSIGTSTVPLSGKIKKTSALLTSANISGILPGEIIRTKIFRDIDVDDANAVAELHKVEIRTVSSYI